jgi:uncharacterized protein YecE (DUF72 family)
MNESPRASREILVGTSGYGYVEWVGPVYAEGSRPEDFLTQYASMFPTVELNYSYYKMPTAEQLTRLMDQAGPSLVFSVKANCALTHTIDPATWKETAREFMAALEPLRKAERLGAMLFQFPFSFQYEVDRRRYLDAVLALFAELPLAAEFRNPEWYNNRVLDAFRARRVAIVTLDMPALPGLPPVMDVVTSPLAYIRFHGRNGASWWGSNSASRYDYLYPDAELEAWAGRVRAIAEKAERILVYFNNPLRGQAVRNATSFAGILDREGLPS